VFTLIQLGLMIINTSICLSSLAFFSSIDSCVA